MANNMEKSEKYTWRNKIYSSYIIISIYNIAILHSVLPTLYSFLFLWLYIIYKMCYIVCYSGKRKNVITFIIFLSSCAWYDVHTSKSHEFLSHSCLVLQEKKGKGEARKKRKMPKEKFSSTSFIFGGGNGSKCYFIFWNCDALYFSALFMKV